MIIGIGDSLTYGSIGYSYITYLPIKVVNKGSNGNPIMGLYIQLKKLLNKPKYSSADTFIVAIGINDAFLPELKKVSKFWKSTLNAREKLGGYHYCTADSEFEAEYEKILKLLRAQDKKALLIGLPKTELRNCGINDSSQRRNRIIQNLARKYAIKFIDTYHLMDSIVVSKNNKGYSWGKSNGMRFLDSAACMLIPPLNDVFSKARNLNLTVDGLHFNSSSAKILADEIAKNLH